ncbi:MAG: DHCW motif cupin fold protein [Bosea sp. (in: a-proteobacteria)]|uniref:DHCW motif cupin fold protein n=1 Tax=Bosea sp. (in: a-proteobacteria) TaxID=1871050 RepID=UPI00273384AA|nr:DHCW motif cupin fold protein [Bosea sp. (in: a-proteobacteria)]MDP3256147.1 DHCW motif cupin fold protein [Bosea sp. (in: a-proteobacteria)]MDP3321249.1 DHCW motif cupin fold protein [Bosea sp. (in: a-proteobacteria)]
MKLSDIPFVTTDWSTVPTEHHAGDVGEAIWRVQFFGPAEDRIRVRMVEYSPGYEADHWCSKGHIILCLEGSMETTLEDGRVMPLKAGMSYQVADGAEAHRSRTRTGAKLFIVD